jgi:hypothetical protein
LDIDGGGGGGCGAGFSLTDRCARAYRISPRAVNTHALPQKFLFAVAPYPLCMAPLTVLAREGNPMLMRQSPAPVVRPAQVWLSRGKL